MIIIPVNGNNERMGYLFKTPKHLLLYKGKPAILRSFEYMNQFGKVLILAGHQYYDDIIKIIPQANVMAVPSTSSQVETIWCAKNLMKGDLWIVDCDVVPEELPTPKGNTVYCFENKSGLNQYSNFLVKEDEIVACNEKTMPYRYCGAGVYYFRHYDNYQTYQHGCKSVAEVIGKLLEHIRAHNWAPFGKFYADLDNKIVRLGTLPDIVGSFTGNKLSVVKMGPDNAKEHAWYEAYEDKNDIPGYEMTDIGLKLDFLQSSRPVNVMEVHALIEKYRYYKPLSNQPFEVYRERIAGHLERNPLSNGDKLIDRLKYVTLRPTFCHGDLSVNNIIPTKDGLKLIDPLYSEEKFGSYVLDYAKFLFSLKFFSGDLNGYNAFFAEVYNRQTDPLIAAEAVRVAAHRSEFSFIAENLIEEML